MALFRSRSRLGVSHIAPVVLPQYSGLAPSAPGCQPILARTAGGTAAFVRGEPAAGSPLDPHTAISGR